MTKIKHQVAPVRKMRKVTKKKLRAALAIRRRKVTVVRKRMMMKARVTRRRKVTAARRKRHRAAALAMMTIKVTQASGMRARVAARARKKILLETRRKNSAKMTSKTIREIEEEVFALLRAGSIFIVNIYFFVNKVIYILNCIYDYLHQ